MYCPPGLLGCKQSGRQGCTCPIHYGILSPAPLAWPVVGADTYSKSGPDAETSPPGPGEARPAWALAPSSHSSALLLHSTKGAESLLVPGALLGIGNSVINTDKNPCSHGVYLQRRRETSKEASW